MMKYTGLLEQVTRTAVRLFCVSFFCLTSGFYPRGKKHPMLDVSHGSAQVIWGHGQITGLRVHTRNPGYAHTNDVFQENEG